MLFPFCAFCEGLVLWSCEIFYGDFSYVLVISSFFITLPPRIIPQFCPVPPETASQNSPSFVFLSHYFLTPSILLTFLSPVTHTKNFDYSYNVRQIVDGSVQYRTPFLDLVECRRKDEENFNAFFISLAIVGFCDLAFCRACQI